MHRQRGTSLILVCLFLLMLGTCITEAISILPAYFLNSKVRSALESLPKRLEESRKEGATPLPIQMEIKRLMNVQLRINGVGNEVSMDDLQLTKEDDNTISATIDYEIREHLFFNIDVVMKFSEGVNFPYEAS